MMVDDIDNDCGVYGNDADNDDAVVIVDGNEYDGGGINGDHVDK